MSSVFVTLSRRGSFLFPNYIEKKSVFNYISSSVRPKTWPHGQSNIFLRQWKFMKPIKYNSVVSAYIFERWCVPHILSELLEGPEQGPHIVHHLNGPDLTYLRKLKVAPIKMHFPEKFSVMKMCAIDQVMSLRMSYQYLD
jgi:hypothetical protein